MITRDKIEMLESRLTGLANDSRYWDLRRTFGDASPKLRHDATRSQADALQRSQGASIPPETRQPVERRLADASRPTRREAVSVSLRSVA